MGCPPKTTNTYRFKVFGLGVALGFATVIFMAIQQQPVRLKAKNNVKKIPLYPANYSAVLSKRPIVSFRTSCQEKRHVVFIKVHKAGSSTITNILFRFGVHRNMTFALPRKGVIITFWQGDDLENLLQAPKGRTFDILCSHAVYSRERMDEIMPKDTMYFGIVREPISLLQSAVHFFFQKQIPGDNKLRTYLRNPDILRIRRLLNNSMSYEFALPYEHFGNPLKIEKHLERLDQEFSVIIVMERMAESLVLIRRYMCWRLQDILYLPRNTNSDKPQLNLTNKETAQLRQMVMADMMLYNFSVQRLERQIAVQNADFWGELDVFKSMLRQLSDFCGPETGDVSGNSALTFSASRWSAPFTLYSSQCKELNFGGFQILRFVKQYQYHGNTKRSRKRW